MHCADINSNVDYVLCLQFPKQEFVVAQMDYMDHAVKVSSSKASYLYPVTILIIACSAHDT